MHMLLRVFERQQASKREKGSDQNKTNKLYTNEKIKEIEMQIDRQIDKQRDRQINRQRGQK